LQHAPEEGLAVPDEEFSKLLAVLVVGYQVAQEDELAFGPAQLAVFFSHLLEKVEEV
jgi:hypothetical protein